MKQIDSWLQMMKGFDGYESMPAHLILSKSVEDQLLRRVRFLTSPKAGHYIGTYWGMRFVVSALLPPGAWGYEAHDGSMVLYNYFPDEPDKVLNIPAPPKFDPLAYLEDDVIFEPYKKKFHFKPDNV